MTMKRKVIRYQVMNSYISPYPDAIIFRKGEKVKVGDEFKEDPDWKDWIWCEGQNDNQAWIPKQYIDVDGRKGILLRDYNALELSVEPGEKLTVSEEINGFGMAEKSDGSRGWIPMKNLVEK